jgi:CrcB protein
MSSRLSMSGQLRMTIFVGFFGAFTTFSSFMFESAQLINESQYLWAAGNVIGQNIIGLLAVFVGLSIGNLI